MAAVGQIRNIGGLQPLFDPKRVEGTFVVNGANFIVDSQGVGSGFARECVLRQAVREPRGAQAFRLRESETSLLCTQDAILRYDEDNRQLVPLLTYQPLTDFFPWSACIVGGHWYFARRGVGLVEYNVQTGVWSIVSGADVPADIVACCEKGGRLVVVAPGLLAWSAIDQGRDMTPSTTTGAGFQSLSLIGATDPGDPLMVLPYANGVLTYTREGIMKSELIIAANPFRHRPMTDQHIPINGYCAIRLGQRDHVILTRQGFFSTQGEDWQPWQAAMGEYFHQTLLPSYDLADPAVVRLTYDRDRQWFFASLAEAVNQAVYNRAYMIHMPVPHWGLLNRVHTAFIDFRFTTQHDIGDDLSYLDNQGTIWQFINNTADLCEDFNDLWTYDYRGPVEWPARSEEAVAKMPTVLYFRPVSEGIFQYGPAVYDQRTELGVVRNMPDELPEVTLPPSESVWDGGASVWDGGASRWDEQQLRFSTTMKMTVGVRRLANVFATQERLSLQSYAEIGIFRPPDEQAIDVLSQLTDLQVAGAVANEERDVFLDYIEDFLGADVVEDWGAVDKPTRDYGFERGSTSDYRVSTVGTIDGVNTYEFEDRLATEVFQEGRTKFFAPDTTGLYHIVRVQADQPDFSYKIQTVEIRAINVGRLT